MADIFRLSEPGRRLYKCAVCGYVGYWSEGWRWWGSLKDEDEGRDVPCYCPKCQRPSHNPTALEENR